MAIRKEKQNQLTERMDQLGILEKDLIETFIRGSGKGGQKQNKTSNCVQLHHSPSGITIKCQKERSREMNRFFARRELCDLIEEQMGKTTKKQREQEKLRKQKKRRSRRTQQKTTLLQDDPNGTDRTFP